MFGSRLYLQAARTKRKNGKIGELKKLTLFNKSEIFKQKSVFTILGLLAVSVHEAEHEALLTSHATGFRRSAAFVYLFIYFLKLLPRLI
jgi:hypothetical protein